MVWAGLRWVSVRGGFGVRPEEREGGTDAFSMRGKARLYTTILCGSPSPARAWLFIKLAVLSQVTSKRRPRRTKKKNEIILFRMNKETFQDKSVRGFLQ